MFTIGEPSATQAEALAYIRNKWVPAITDAELQQVALAYPTDPNQGSPYDSGLLNQQTPVYKMLSSFNGDLIFQAPRRLFLSIASKTQKTWSYGALSPVAQFDSRVSLTKTDFPFLFSKQPMTVLETRRSSELSTPVSWLSSSSLPALSESSSRSTTSSISPTTSIRTLE